MIWPDGDSDMEPVGSEAHDERCRCEDCEEYHFYRAQMDDIVTERALYGADA